MTPATLPDLPKSEEEVENERARNSWLNLMVNVPDLNVMKNNSVLVSSHGAMSFGLGDIPWQVLLEVGFKC